MIMVNTTEQPEGSLMPMKVKGYWKKEKPHENLYPVDGQSKIKIWKTFCGQTRLTNCRCG
jgi:hypothetical protein